MAMPSIGASFANSQTQKSGGQVIFAPQHSTGAARVRAEFSGGYTDTQTSEATAKTDMGGGLFGGGGGGGGDGGGFGLGGLISGIGGALGLGRKSSGATAAASAGDYADTGGSGGGNWLPLLLIGGGLLAIVALVLVSMKGD